MLFDIAIDAAEGRKLERELAGIAGAFPKAAVEAVNHTLSKSRTLMVRAMGERYTLKRSKISQAVTSVRASLKGNQMEGMIITRGRPLSLINYNIKGKSLAARRRGPRAGGIKVQVLRGGPWENLRHAFITYGKGNNLHVFQRTMAGGKPVPRMPIAVLPAPSAPAQAKTIVPLVEREISDALAYRLRHNVDHLLSTGGKWR